MPSLLDMFRTKKKVEDEVLTKDSLRKLILNENGMDKMVWFSAVKQFDSDEKGTLIEFFVNNEKKPSAKGLSINGASVEVKLTPEIKSALNSDDIIRIKRSQVDFKQNGLKQFNGTYTFKDINKVNEVGSYTTNTNRMQTPVIRNKNEIIYVPETKVVRPTHKKQFIPENKPLKKIEEFQRLSKQFEYSDSFFNQYFHLFLDENNNVQVRENADDKNKAWSYINTYETDNNKIKEKYIELTKDKNHFDAIKQIKQTNTIRTIDGKVIPLKSIYIIQSLEQKLLQEQDFIFKRWNSKMVDEDEVKEYINNRRSIYDINSKKRTYTNDEVVNGSENRDVGDNFYDNVNQESKKQMQTEDKENTQGTTNKFKHTMSNSTFYKYASK